MALRCIVDDEVAAGVGSKFILVKSGDGFALVSKCFPAYRFARIALRPL
jgi:hypothetical protein